MPHIIYADGLRVATQARSRRTITESLRPFLQNAKVSLNDWNIELFVATAIGFILCTLTGAA